eukprot:13135350-Alexandrium_andersonii.AAC.1
MFGHARAPRAQPESARRRPKVQEQFPDVPLKVHRSARKALERVLRSSRQGLRGPQYGVGRQ